MAAALRVPVVYGFKVIELPSPYFLRRGGFSSAVRVKKSLYNLPPVGDNFPFCFIDCPVCLFMLYIKALINLGKYGAVKVIILVFIVYFFIDRECPRRDRLRLKGLAVPARRHLRRQHAVKVPGKPHVVYEQKLPFFLFYYKSAAEFFPVKLHGG